MCRDNVWQEKPGYSNILSTASSALLSNSSLILNSTEKMNLRHVMVLTVCTEKLESSDSSSDTFVEPASVWFDEKN